MAPLPSDRLGVGRNYVPHHDRPAEIGPLSLQTLQRRLMNVLAPFVGLVLSERPGRPRLCAVWLAFRC